MGYLLVKFVVSHPRTVKAVQQVFSFIHADNIELLFIADFLY